MKSNPRLSKDARVRLYTDPENQTIKWPRTRNSKYLRFWVLITGIVVVAFVALGSGALRPSHGQTASTQDRDRGRMMLKAIKDSLKKHYYDPNFRGIDIEGRFKAAEEKINQAQSLSQIFGIIGQVLVDFGDSHTFFVPPSRVNRIEYGWLMQMVGDKCYVNAVKPGSDAAAKGLKEGDQIVSIDGIAPNRQILWMINYAYRTLRPRPGMRLAVIKPDGQQQQLDVLAKIHPGKKVMDLTGEDIWALIRESETESRLNRHQYVELGDDLSIWKMPQFDLPDNKVDELAGKFRNKKGLILDLRGNSGGLEDMMLRLIGHVFDRNITLGELKRRKETKPLIAKTRGKDAFAGKLIVLIDSESGSASELFARIVQLEKRGTVIGDVSAGAVMRSLEHSLQLGVDVVTFYGVSITDADVIMADGKSLERAGVTPDEIKLPSPADMAEKRDPVLAYAASVLGVTLSPEKAGQMFPLEWRK